MSQSKRILVLGGSGFVSGTLAEGAAAAGHEVYAVTRGRRALPHGIQAVMADRTDRVALSRAVERIGQPFDLVADCICYSEADALQDVQLFSRRCARFVFVSTESVYDPAARSIPQDERDAVFLDDGYGGDKRRAELAFERTPTDLLPWTILRPPHIYGPGSHLGCIPRHARDPELVARLLGGHALELAGGGHSLLQPLFVDDLVSVILACLENDASVGGIYNVAGPQTIETRRYYEIIAQTLSVRLHTVELPFDAIWEDEPRFRGHLCHRVQSLERLQAAGLPLPSTRPDVGLPLHVRSLMSE